MVRKMAFVVRIIKIMVRKMVFVVRIMEIMVRIMEFMVQNMAFPGSMVNRMRIANRF